MFAPTIGLALKLQVTAKGSPSTAWIILDLLAGVNKTSGLNFTLMVVDCTKCTPFLSSKALLEAKQERLVSSLWALKVRRLRVWKVNPLASRVTSSWMLSWKNKKLSKKLRWLPPDLMSQDNTKTCHCCLIASKYCMTRCTFITLQFATRLLIYGDRFNTTFDGSHLSPLFWHFSGI